LSQIVFLLLFLFLLPSTQPHLFLKIDPFIALSNALGTHALYRGLLWSLLVLIPTFFLGRFFCGWVCPLGTLHHFFSSIRSGWKRGRPRIESNRYHTWQTFKYYLLFALLAATALGCSIGGLLDPISLALRSFGLSILPAAHYAIDSALSFRQTHFRQAFLLGSLFIALLSLNLRITRFWCRALCPLGALLGACSRWSVIHLEKDSRDCHDCNRCLLHCQGGDDPIPGKPWRKAECHLCMNCVADCPETGLRFRFLRSESTTLESPDLGRRQTLASLAAGVAALPLFRAGTGLAGDANASLIRPPGSLDESEFLSRCIRCGECMKVCPNNALHPAWQEAGVEGLWTPVLVPRIGYCEPACTLCGEVCPTGAIRPFSEKEKAGIRLGTAFYDRGRCLPWAMATECIVCEEWCPTSPKAIYLVTAQTVDSAGAAHEVRQPWVDPQRCIGCGACEYACPVRERPAVYVTSVGESRSRNNQLVLDRRKPSAAMLPDIPGWRQTRPTRAFEAANLWQYVDGDADRYVHAGVRQTLTAEYRSRDAIDVTVDVHVMNDDAGARRIMESESASASESIVLGDECRLYGQVLTFRKGVHFVRLVASQDMPQTAPALIELAHALERKLR
jgi:polyferredoxin